MSSNLNFEKFLQSRLKLRHLQLVLAIDEQRNLHRAAEKIHIAQPAASKLLSELERIVGTPLFVRHSRGLIPTVQGDIFVRNSALILKTLNQTATEVKAATSGEAGTVTIGTITGPMIEFLVEIIENARKIYPTIKIVVEHSTSDILLKKVLDGHLDFALGRVGHGVDPEKFTYQKLHSEQCMFLCRDGHPLAKKPIVQEADFLEWPWVMQPRGSLLRYKIEQLFLRANLPMPESIVATTSAIMSLIFVLRSDAVTILESNTANLMVETGKWCQIRYKEQLYLDHYGLITAKDRLTAPAASIVYNEILKLADRKQ